MYYSPSLYHFSAILTILYFWYTNSIYNNLNITMHYSATSDQVLYIRLCAFYVIINH